MIFRKPTLIQIKAEEDMQDIQPINRNTPQFTPNNPNPNPNPNPVSWYSNILLH